MPGAGDVALAEAEGAAASVSGALIDLHSMLIAPLEPSIWAPEYDGRADAICALSQRVDDLETAARGPLLAGKSLSRADGVLFPTFCALWSSMPAHYGWKEWSDEAIFYKRPRLHAWFELMNLDAAGARTAAAIQADVESLDWSWAAPVPTFETRTIPKHAV